MKNTSQGYPRNYTANTTGDILQVAEKSPQLGVCLLWQVFLHDIVVKNFCSKNIFDYIFLHS